MKIDSAVVFTDLHLGLKNNAKRHNEDCMEFIDWMIEEAKVNDIRTCICMGDLHHIRSSLNINTLAYSVDLHKKLNDNFEQVILIVGNHDMPYRDNRNVYSYYYAQHFTNITVVDQPMEIDGIGFIPWLVGDEWHEVANMQCDYFFGHLELPGFILTGNYRMPETGELNMNHFINAKNVFTGHFHKRQNLGNIWYIGNCFPHNYGDSFDEKERGMMFFHRDEDPEFKMWPSTPKYRYTELSDVIENHDVILGERTYLRGINDIDITAEDLNFIRETFTEFYDLREFNVVQNRIEADSEEFTDDFESVDEVVITQLNQVDSALLDSNVLIELYRAL